MKTLRCFLLLALVAAVVGTAFAQTLTKTGTTAAPLLKIGVGPRAIGMGGAFAATADDILALYWNPGGLGNSFGNEAFFNHTFWFADIAVDYAAVTARIGDLGTLGVFVTSMTLDEMDVRTVEQPRGTGERFDAGSMVIGLSYGRNLTDNFGIGFTAKYIREDIWHSSATGFAFDVGVLYRIEVLNELRLAATVSNFGPKMQMEGIDNLMVVQVGGSTGNLINTYVEVEEFDLPLLFRVGVAADVIKEEENRLTLAVDAVHPNDNTEYLNTGAEYGWNDMLFVRAGWKSLFERDTEQGWTAGVGLHYRIVGSVKVKVDYAYQDFGRLANVQYLSLAVVF
jgi:opacity protein-like surface antigen